MKNTPYTPPKRILENYADVLVNFALNSGEGIKKGDVVIVSGNEACKPLYAQVIKAIWKAGGHIIENYKPINEPYFSFDRQFFEYAGEEQLLHFPKKYLKGLVDEARHSLFIGADTDVKSLKGVDPKNIMKRQESRKPYIKWLDKKENEGNFTWTYCIYGTPQMAEEAGLSTKAYWNQIIKACFLDEKSPISRWKKVYKQTDRFIDKLNELQINKLHITGEDVDLYVTLSPKSKWVGGRGRNIPGFEVFTSPDCRETEGWIRLNQPLYRYGNIIDGIELWFDKGRVVKSKAKKNHKVLTAMLDIKNADRVGEFSLTDSRHSHITKFMAETLYDENVGGKYGNTHIALGHSYHDCFDVDPTKTKKSEWTSIGYNDSPIHTDVVSTTDRTVTAYLKNGGEKIIYKNGMFSV